MTRLVRTLATLEEAIIALERRGISLKIHAERQDPHRPPPDLPRLHGRPRRMVHHPRRARRLRRRPGKRSRRQTRRRRRHAHRRKSAAPSANGDGAAAGDRGRAPIAPRLRIVELHEVRTINTMLADLDQIRLRHRSPDPARAHRREEPPLHAPPRRKRNRPGRPPRPARRHPRRRRKRPARSPASKASAK